MSKSVCGDREGERERESEAGGMENQAHTHTHTHLGEISSQLRGTNTHTHRYNKRTKRAQGYTSLLLDSLLLSLSSESESSLSDTILSLEDDFDFLARYFFALW